MNPSPKPNRNFMLCRHLRTKMMYLPMEEPDYFSSTTASFWCLRTLKVVGPDDGPVCAHDCCNPTRTCYENDAVPARPPVA
ncbi:hypothetical protein HS125_00555 [bacterium]|nr:hypothetical protein [bacterium]